MRLAIIVGAVWGVAGCGTPAKRPAPYTTYRGGDVALSRAADASMLQVPAGTFVAGSTTDERDRAYETHRTTSGDAIASSERWFDREGEPRQGTLPSFVIDIAPVTVAAYAEFVADTGMTPPPTWRDGAAPSDRANHPVVGVTWYEAAAYCAWRGSVVGQARRLPTADEYEKAARGDAGKTYPWGDAFDAGRLNSAATGIGDTVPVGQFDTGASAYGMLDAAGNAAQWTSTPWAGGNDQMTVKGSSYKDHGGLGRGAWERGHPARQRDDGIGFRCRGE